MSYLNESHPEIFSTAPRTGGAVRIEPSEEESTPAVGTKGSKVTLKSTKSLKSTRSKSKSVIDAKIFASTPAYVSREYRIQHAFTAVPWALFNEDDDEDKSQQPNPMQDSVDILAVTITTIMLLAAGHKDISKNHLRWTLSYLECIKDEYDNSPPNVQGIINHIKLLDASLESFNESVEAVVLAEDGAKVTPKPSNAPGGGPADQAPPQGGEAGQAVQEAEQEVQQAAPAAGEDAAPTAGEEAAPAAGEEAAPTPGEEAATAAGEEAATAAGEEAAPTAGEEAEG